MAAIMGNLSSIQKILSYIGLLVVCLLIFFLFCLCLGYFCFWELSLGLSRLCILLYNSFFRFRQDELLIAGCFIDWCDFIDLQRYDFLTHNLHHALLYCHSCNILHIPIGSDVGLCKT